MKQDQVDISFDFHSERRLYYNLLNNIKNMRMLDMNLPIVLIAMGFRMNSAFKYKFAKVDTWFKESGLDVKWESDLLRVVRPDTKISTYDINDDDVISTSFLYVMTWGPIAAIIFFLLELAYYRIEKKIKSRILKKSKLKEPRKLIRIRVKARV